VAEGWKVVVDRFLDGPDGQRIAQFVRQRLAAGAVIYPSTPFSALALTPLAAVRVVILGQDPYHGPGQAHGLAFSVPVGVRPPPSLRNILSEIGRNALGAPGSKSDAEGRSGNLVHWADQGVLLLNTCLTVENGLPGSHFRQGWEAFADELLRTVLGRGQPVVIMLWGAQAQARRVLIASAGHHDNCLVLTANHPSPLSARRPPVPFIGCDHFRVANRFLASHGVSIVNWSA
jgi:uracil-DNA glycosylase